MAGFVVGLNAFSNYKVARIRPKDDEQHQVFSTTLAFNNTQTLATIDLSGDDRAVDFQWASMYVDNSSPNSVPITFIIGGTGQRIVVKANTEGFLPVIAGSREDSGSNLSATVSAPSAGAQTALVQVMLLNYKVDPAVWATA